MWRAYDALCSIKKKTYFENVENLRYLELSVIRHLPSEKIIKVTRTQQSEKTKMSHFYDFNNLQRFWKLTDTQYDEQNFTAALLEKASIHFLST